MDRADRIQLDAGNLAAELAGRWPGAVGEHRAATDEVHRLALLHPQFDGFLSIEVTARCDLEGVFVLPDPGLASVVTAHHRTGPLAREQVLPIDLELHPLRLPARATTGTLQLVDPAGEQVAPAVRLTVATDATLECVIAGATDGPFGSADAFELAVSQLLAGEGSARRLARRVEALLAGRPDPGWGRRPWRRR